MVSRTQVLGISTIFIVLSSFKKKTTGAKTYHKFTDFAYNCRLIIMKEGSEKIDEPALKLITRRAFS